MNELPIPYTSVTAMVSAWTQASELLKQGQGLIRNAEAVLSAAFNPKYSGLTYDHAVRHGHAHPLETDAILNVWKEDAWRTLFERMEVRRVCSVQRAKALDQMLHEKDKLPAITEQNVLDILRSTLDQIPEMLRELVHEVYDWLRPRRREYKTNDKYAVGRKVIVLCIDNDNWVTKPRVNHYRQAELTGLDNVFGMLAGSGSIGTSYFGPMCDAISRMEAFGQTGETEFFKFKPYRNGNLHIEFKRLDLLAEFNALAGADKLAPDNQEVA